MNNGLRGNSLSKEAICDLPFQHLQSLIKPRDGILRQYLRARLLCFLDNLGEGHTVGGQDARVFVDDDAFDAQLHGHFAGVLPACTSERGEDVLARLKPTSFCQGADWPAHGLVCHVNKAVSHFPRSHGPASVLVDLCRESLELLSDNLGIERQVLVRPKDGWEEVRDESAEKQIGIRDGKWAALAIARWAGMRPSTLKVTSQKHSRWLERGWNEPRVRP